MFVWYFFRFIFCIFKKSKEKIRNEIITVLNMLFNIFRFFFIIYLGGARACRRVCIIALKIHEATILTFTYCLYDDNVYINSNRIHSEPLNCSLVSLAPCISISGHIQFFKRFFVVVPNSDKKLIALTYTAPCIWLWANSCIYIGARTCCEK